MPFSSRHLAIVLVTVVTLIAVAYFVAFRAVTPALLNAMSPGETTPVRWRLVGMEFLGIAIVAGLFALSRLARRDDRGLVVGAIAAGLTAIGTVEGGHIYGWWPGGTPVIMCCGVVAIALCAMIVRPTPLAMDRRHVDRASARVWLAALLQALSIFSIISLTRDVGTTEPPLGPLLLSMPQWIVAWRFGIAGHLSRWDAGLATALGILGLIWMALMSILPISYYGPLARYLFHSQWGLAFYITLGVGSWLFLRAGSALRESLGAPPRDRGIAIAAAVGAIPAFPVAAYFVEQLLGNL